MDLIDEEHITFAEIRQQRGQVAGLFDRRAGCDAEVYPHLIGDDARKRCFAEARRAIEQHMVERFPAPTRRLYINT